MKFRLQNEFTTLNNESPHKYLYLLAKSKRHDYLSKMTYNNGALTCTKLIFASSIVSAIPQITREKRLVFGHLSRSAFNI